MKKVFETGGHNPVKGASPVSMITVRQRESGRRLFDVVYGLQVDAKLTYSEACAKLGQAILHMQCCEGIASNEGD
jgi:hypothetical protein